MLRNLNVVRLFSNNFKALTVSENKTIVEELNKSSVNDLSKFKISEARAARIVKHRLENGIYKTSEELFELKGIGGVAGVNKFFQSIISPEKPKKVKEKHSTVFTVPETHEGISGITSCTSIKVGISNVSCVSFQFSSEDKTIQVTNLENYIFNERKLHVSELVNKVIEISKHIPDCQCYVLENPRIAAPGSPGNAEQVNINVQQSQVLAMLSLILSRRKTTLPNVFYLKRYIHAKLFKLLIGNEMVTTKSVVNEILEEDQGYLKIDYEIKMKFENLENFEKEYLRQTLLMGIAFIKLSVFKCAKSLRCLERNG